ERLDNLQGREIELVAREAELLAGEEHARAQAAEEASALSARAEELDRRDQEVAAREQEVRRIEAAQEPATRDVLDAALHAAAEKRIAELEEELGARDAMLADAKRELADVAGPRSSARRGDGSAFDRVHEERERELKLREARFEAKED